MRPVPTQCHVARGAVCVLGTRVICAKTDEPIDMPLGRQTRASFRDLGLNRGPR